MARSKSTREALDAQSIPYSLVSAHDGRPQLWPIKCLTQAGYIGMWRTYRKAWNRAQLRCPGDYALLLESDAVVPSQFIPAFGSALGMRGPRLHDPIPRVLWLDERNLRGPSPSGCCTVATAYHRSTWIVMAYEFASSSKHALWVNYTTRPKLVVDHPDCLTDWYLANVAAYRRIPSASVPIVGHPAGHASEINPGGAVGNSSVSNKK